MPGSRSHQSHPPRVKPSAFRERAAAWPRWEENSGFRTGSPPDPQPSWSSANLRERGYDPGPRLDHPPASPVPNVGYWADGREDSDLRALFMEEGAGRMGGGGNPRRLTWCHDQAWKGQQVTGWRVQSHFVWSESWLGKMMEGGKTRPCGQSVAWRVSICSECCWGQWGFCSRA